MIMVRQLNHIVAKLWIRSIQERMGESNTWGMGRALSRAGGGHIRAAVVAGSDNKTHERMVVLPSKG